jgi:hypothetical protein
MPQQLRFHLSLPPSEVVARIAEETVPLPSVLNLRSPLQSYATFIRESFSGSRQFLSKIEGETFAIMSIGFWPFKGSMIGAYVGRMQGTVKPSGTGSIVEAGFRLFPISVISAVAMTFVFALFAMVLLIFALTTAAQMGSGMRIFALLQSGVFLCFGLFCPVYIAVCASMQKRATSRFLQRLFADGSE